MVLFGYFDQDNRTSASYYDLCPILFVNVPTYNVSKTMSTMMNDRKLEDYCQCGFLFSIYFVRVISA
jgi:hypothetical protein